MTSSVKVLDPREIEATDAQASLFMEEGIRLMQSGNGTDAALLCFDRAFELRRRLPIGGADARLWSGCVLAQSR